MEKRRHICILVMVLLLGSCIITSLYGSKTDSYRECLQCGKKNPDTNTFCSFCGIKLTKQVDEAEVDSMSADRAEMLYEKGVSFVISGNYDAATAIFEKILKDCPSSPYSDNAEILHKSCKDILALRDDLAREKVRALSLERERNRKEKKPTSDSELKRIAGGCLGGLGSLLLLILVASGFSCLL